MAYFTVPQARAAAPAIADPTVYSDSRIDETRAAVEEALERACGVAFEPREQTDRLDGTCGRSLKLRPRPASVLACTLNGTALSASQLEEIVLRASGFAYRHAGWHARIGGVQITYRHGHPQPPGRVRRAAILLVAQWLTSDQASQDGRLVSFGTDDGSARFLVAGQDGPFDHPEINAVVSLYGGFGAGVA